MAQGHELPHCVCGGFFLVVDGVEVCVQTDVKRNQRRRRDEHVAKHKRAWSDIERDHLPHLQRCFPGIRVERQVVRGGEGKNHATGLEEIHENVSVLREMPNPARDKKRGSQIVSRKHVFHVQ